MIKKVASLTVGQIAAPVAFIITIVSAVVTIETRYITEDELRAKAIKIHNQITRIELGYAEAQVTRLYNEWLKQVDNRVLEIKYESAVWKRNEIRDRLKE